MNTPGQAGRFGEGQTADSFGTVFQHARLKLPELPEELLPDAAVVLSADGLGVGRPRTDVLESPPSAQLVANRTRRVIWSVADTSALHRLHGEGSDPPSNRREEYPAGGDNRLVVFWPEPAGEVMEDLVRRVLGAGADSDDADAVVLRLVRLLRRVLSSPTPRLPKFPEREGGASHVADLVALRWVDMARRKQLGLESGPLTTDMLHRLVVEGLGLGNWVCRDHYRFFLHTVREALRRSPRPVDLAAVFPGRFVPFLPSVTDGHWTEEGNENLRGAGHPAPVQP